MSDAITVPRRIRIALAGNPNAGKTTLFNALTGSHHKVGNYPGVTVEKREGSIRRKGIEYRFIDLPGVYSLTAYSIDEVVARDFLLEEAPDLIIDVLDATNLERNLYLCLQFQELGIPVVGALNMSDEAEAKGIAIDAEGLGRILGFPLVKTVGPKSQGLERLLDLVDSVLAGRKQAEAKVLDYGAELEERLAPLAALIESDRSFAARYPARWLAVKLLEKDAHAHERLAAHPRAAGIEAAAAEAIAWLEKHYAKDAEIIVSERRYAYIHGAVKETLRVTRKPDFSVTERIDRIIMNPFLALPLFVAVLWAVFKLTFALGEFPMAWFESLFGWLGGLAMATLPAGFLRSLLVDGIIGGVGGVFSFVPLIVILFLLLSVLEDSGYLSRAAFATDKLLHSFGLHGQSVFPLMLGFGCSVPAIMAARTLKSRRDRIITILVIPFMSCGAKLPVHVLFAAAFFPERQAEMVMLVYAVGVLLSLGSAWVLRRTLLRGDATPFVMELPPYRAPTLRGVLWHVWDKTWHYVRKAGTVILASSLLIWALTSFPRSEGAEANLEGSAAAAIGRFIEPAFRPLGFDWKLSVATVTGFAAKEVVVSTLGVLYGVGSEESEESEGLRQALREDSGLTPLVGLVFMLFILAIPPCFAALATIRAELGWGWLGFAFVFMLAVGWILGFAVFQAGSLLAA
jgi:ferrous iron transport protein B